MQPSQSQSFRPPPIAVQIGAAFLLDGVTCIICLGAAVLMAACIYDATASWRHRAHFRSCRKKVEGVHAVLNCRMKGGMPLCPVCVEPVSMRPSPFQVVFICGHRFHMKCANAYCRESPNARAGACPMCEGPESAEAPSKGVEAPDAMCEFSNSIQNCASETKAFILRSLHQKYPDIVTKACVERWRSCHTEIWLQELECPRYQSIFDWLKHK